MADAVVKYLQGGPPVSTMAQNPWNVAGGEGANQTNSWMNQSLGAQRNATDDYVRRASTTGVQRGGMGVAGGQNWGAGLQQGAIKSLAAGANDRWTGANNYLNQQNQAWGNIANINQQAMASNASTYATIQRSVSEAATAANAARNAAAMQAASLAAQAKQQASQQDWQGLQNTQAQQAALAAQQGQQGWQGGQNTQQQRWQGGQNTQQQRWQGGQNTQQQGWQGLQNTQQQQAALAAQMAQQGWQGGQNTQQQGWQGGQNTQLQNWNTAQNALNRQQTQSGLNQTQLFQLMMSQLGG